MSGTDEEQKQQKQQKQERQQLSEDIAKSYAGKNTLTPDILAQLVEHELAFRKIVRDILDKPCTEQQNTSSANEGGRRRRASSRKFKKSSKRVFRKKSRATRRR